jgi:hypothetical protein
MEIHYYQLEMIIQLNYGVFNLLIFLLIPVGIFINSNIYYNIKI